MPSPVGHALAGVAAGWLVRGAPRSLAHRSPGRREAVVFAALGMAPDLDLLIGWHSGPTHGLGFAVLAAAAAWLPGLRGSGVRLRLALACVIAYMSHILLDWLGTDTSAPIGIMALWPFSRDYYQSELHVFMAVSRRIFQPERFWMQNLAALAREVLILVPVALLVAVTRRDRRA